LDFCIKNQEGKKVFLLSNKLVDRRDEVTFYAIIVAGDSTGQKPRTINRAVLPPPLLL
jgi:hypothetical protein